ncbi:hypothetical protein XELAEV_18045668mg [Xenopus laevis]|uniref:Snake toxin/toxin-like domain-containing protein n=1 Tax=Xenopus laevis TaxID=8355 RepID=A0A974C165_XENLA|nr:hypothetical protein XELAEV_18045668mg [Xenopus laevis]
MKLIILCAVLLTVLLQETESAKKPLECYACSLPNDCLKLKNKVCEPSHDTCQQSFTIVPDDSENAKPDAKKKFVWERLCTTAAACKKAENRRGRLKANCCKEPLCNV